MVDDWDGIGQRRTGTGTTRFDQVVVHPRELLAIRPRTEARAAADVSFLQLYLHAVVAGILRSVVTDATELVRSRTRTFDHAPTPQPLDDPILDETVGRLAATAWLAESAVLSAADAVAAAAVEEAVGPAASYAVSAVKVHLDQLSTEGATALFDVGGASASSAAKNLDRHWRNLHTITLHNPAAYKATALGRLHVNGDPLPRNGYF